MLPDATLDAIPGWFWPQDRTLFRWFLEQQATVTGDIAELGVYMGKTAVLLGAYLKPTEVLTVIDLFGAEAADHENDVENKHTYPELSRSRFESYYGSVHRVLPNVVQGYSQDITVHARHRRHRFVHVDASHLYEHVRGDIAAAEVLLAPGGVVVFDDFRSSHTPGVAAAVWQEVTTGGLQVLAVSEVKMYACWSDHEQWRQRLLGWLPDSGLPYECQDIAGQQVVRVGEAPTSGGSAGRPRSRELARGLAPPLLVHAVRRMRARART